MTPPELCHSGILYANLPRLRSCVAGTAAGAGLAELPQVDTIAALSQFLGGLHVWCNKTLADAALRVTPWSITDPDDLRTLQLGDLRSFQFGVRTRGIGYWGIDDYRSGEIYRKASGIFVSMIVDPAWITGDHGHCILRSGNVNLCGIFAVRDVDCGKNVVVGAPIVLGEPVSDFGRIVSPDSVHLMCRSECNNGP